MALNKRQTSYVSILFEKALPGSASYTQRCLVLYQTYSYLHQLGATLDPICKMGDSVEHHGEPVAITVQWVLA